MTEIKNPVARRAFVTGFGVGAAALGAGLASRATAKETAKPAMAAHWQPTFESQDQWMEMPGKHRFVFDSISAAGAGEAIFFANNFLEVSHAAYGLAPSDNATIVVMRHYATPFGYKNAMWAKYGAVWGKLLKHKDPKTKKFALRNTLMTVPEHAPPDRQISIPIMVGKSVHFAICGAATHVLAGMIAKQTKGDAKAIEAELGANLVANAHMVPAGIVAVNRAQERGYAFSYIG